MKGFGKQLYTSKVKGSKWTLNNGLKNDNKFRCSRLAGLASGGRCCYRGPAAVGLAVVVLTGIVAVAVGAAAAVALGAPAHPGVAIPVLVLTEGAAVASHAAAAASL